MKIDLTNEEIELIKSAIWVGRNECYTPNVYESEHMEQLMAKLRADEWLLVHGENYFASAEEYMCSECKETLFGDPPKRCPSCGSFNKYRGRVTTVRIEEDQYL